MTMHEMETMNSNQLKLWFCPAEFELREGCDTFQIRGIGEL